MIAKYKNNTNVGIAAGFGVQILARVILTSANTPGRPPTLGPLGGGFALSLVGVALFVWGCCNYMMGKGYHRAFGWFGLLSCVGLIVLVCFPDKHKGGIAPTARGFEVLPPGAPPAYGQPPQYPPDQRT